MCDARIAQKCLYKAETNGCEIKQPNASRGRNRLTQQFRHKISKCEQGIAFRNPLVRIRDIDRACRPKLSNDIKDATRQWTGGEYSHTRNVARTLIKKYSHTVRHAPVSRPSCHPIA